MWDTIASLFGTIFSTVFPALLKPKQESDNLKKFNEIRFEIAESLNLYSHCYSFPPVRSSESRRKLTDEDEVGIAQLRKHSAKLKAFADTMPANCKDIPVSKLNITKASLYMRLLSGHICVADNEEEAMHSREMAKSLEEKIRSILALK